MCTLDLSFSKYLSIKEAWNILADYQDCSVLSLLEAKEIEKYGVEMLPHIDPVTKKPWRHSDRTRYLQAIKNYYTKKRKDGKKSQQILAKDIWVSFTTVDKLGVYPRAGDGQTPFGIYAFPIDYVIERGKIGESVPFGDRPYMQIFAVKKTKGKSPQKVKIMQMKTPGRQSRYPAGQFGRTKKSKKAFEAGKKGFDVRDFLKLLNYTGSSDLDKLKVSLLGQFDRFSKLAGFSKGDSHDVLYNHLEKVLQTAINDIYSDIKQKNPESWEKEFDTRLKTLEQGLKSEPITTAKSGEPKNLQDFILRIIKSGHFDYYGDDYSDYKYKNLSLKNNTAERLDGKTVSVDDIFNAEGNSAVDNYPSMKTKWEEYKKDPKSQTDYKNLVKSPYWHKAVGLIIKGFKKSLKPIAKKLEQNLDFPFKDEIIQYADAYGLDWKRAVSKTKPNYDTGEFLYRVTDDLAKQQSEMESGRQKAIHWAMVLRKMGIDGFADRWNQASIYTGGGGESTQGFFFEKGTLNHLAQADNQGYVDRSHQTGAPKLELGNLLAQFKRQNGIDPNQRIEADIFHKTRFESLKKLAKLYDKEEDELKSALERENLITPGHIKWGHGMSRGRGKGEPSPRALKNGFARLGKDEEGNVVWLWHVGKTIEELSKVGISSYRTINEPRSTYGVRWNVTSVMPRKQISEIRRKYQKQAKEEIKKQKIHQQKKTKQKKSKEKIYKKYNQLATAEIEEKTEMASGKQMVGTDYEASEFQRNKIQELKQSFPKVDPHPGMLGDYGLEDSWREFAQNYFKKKNKIKPDKGVPDNLIDEFKIFKSEVNKVAGGYGERWKKDDGVSVSAHKYSMEKLPASKHTGTIIKTPEFQKRFKCPECGNESLESEMEAAEGCPKCKKHISLYSRKQYVNRVVHGATTVYRTLLAIQNTFENINNRIDALRRKARNNSENWQNELDQSLNQSLKLIRTLWRIRSTHQDEIDSNYDIQKIMRTTRSYLAQIKQSTQSILKLGDYQKLWPVFWAALRQKIEYLNKLIDGETLKFQVKKRTYISPEDYKKQWKILYPGEETIQQIPEKLRETPLEQIQFVDMEGFGKEAWQNLLRYQMGKGKIPGKDLFKKLYTKWDWIWDEPGLMSLPDIMKHHPLDEIPDPTILNIAKSPSFIKKLVDYQVEKGLMPRHIANNKFKKLMQQYEAQKEFINDPEFQDIPVNLLKNHNIRVEDALKMGRSKWKKLINYQKVMGIAQAHEDKYSEYFDILENSGMTDEEKSLLGSNFGLIKWRDLQNAKIDTIEKASKFLDNLRKFNFIGDYNKQDMLNEWKDWYGKGVPGEEYKEIWDNLPYQFQHGEEGDLYYIKQQFKDPEEFSKYMRYGSANRLFGNYTYKSLKYKLEIWKKEIKSEKEANEKESEKELAPK